MSPSRSLGRAASEAYALGNGNVKNNASFSPKHAHPSASPTRPSLIKGQSASGVRFPGRGSFGEGGKSPPRNALNDRGPSRGVGGGGARAGTGVRIALTVALPFCHLDEVDVEVRASETAEGLLLTVAAEAGLGPVDPLEYFLCPLQAPSEDDAFALSEIMTWEMDKRSLVDGQLRALKQTLGVSSGGSKASSGYARWDRLGFVFDDYRPVHPSTLVSNLGTPWLRMCHRAELAAAAQSSQWLGVAVLPGGGLDALAGSRPLSARPVRGRSAASFAAASAAVKEKSPSGAAGFFAAIQSVGSSTGTSNASGRSATGAGSGPAVVGQKAGASRAAATGSKGCSARLSETVKGVATVADWGPAVMFGPVSSLDKITLCSRVQDSEWCSSVDVASLKTAAGGTACISIEQEKPSSHKDDASSPRTRYDIGIQVGPGEGDFRRTMVLTLLPRYVLVNALPRALQFTQAACRGRWEGVLPPGARQAFHWPFAKSRRALNVRFLSSDPAVGDEWIWSGDLKLDTVGEVALKLRAATGGAGAGGGLGKEYIARVKLALVGASVTVVFERQDLRWPPYRVDNLTSFGIRYRQALSSSDAARVPAAAGGGDAGGGAGVEGGRGRRKGELPWDGLGPQAAAPFSWDQPAGDSRVLSVGFEQAGKWEEREYRLDELEKHRRVSLTRTLPSLDNPRLVGEMLQRQTGTLADVWRRRWVVLKGPVLFLFKEKTCVHLRGAIYLGATRSGGFGGGSAGPQRAQVGQKAGGRDKGDILDKMGNMMDDAVGLLVGPEFVSSGGEDGGGVGGVAGGSATAVTVAAAAAAAATRLTATFPGSGQGAGGAMGGGSGGASMRADEALALGGLMWKHMSRTSEQGQVSWGLDGVLLRTNVTQTLHPAVEDGGDAPGNGFRRTYSGLGGGDGGDPPQVQEAGVPRSGERAGAVPGRRFSATMGSSYHGLSLADWGEVLIDMNVCKGSQPSSSRPTMSGGGGGSEGVGQGAGVGFAAAAAVPSSEAEWICQQLVELGLLVPLSATRQNRQHHGGTTVSAVGGVTGGVPTTPHRGRTKAATGAGEGGISEGNPVTFVSPSRSPRAKLSGTRRLRGNAAGGGGGGGGQTGGSSHERGLRRSGSGFRLPGSQQPRSSFSAESPKVKRYLLRHPRRDVDLDPEGNGVVRILPASGAKHDLRCDSVQAALRWIAAMRDAVDADCVEALMKSGRAKPSGAAGAAAAAATTAAEDKHSPKTGEEASVGDAIMSRLRTKVYVNVRVRADGPTKVLELVEEAGEEMEDDDGAVAAALGKKGKDSSGGSSGMGGPATAESEDAIVSATAATPTSSVTNVYMLQMAGIGLSLVDDRPLELLYFLARGIQAEVSATAT